MDMHKRSEEVDTRSSPSNRILDIPCKVCGDFSSGKHYNIFACDGCAGFFKRTIRRNRLYICKAKAVNCCIIDKTRRNQCRACRLAKCQKVGMNKDAVQHERGPRNSTVRRQLQMQFVDSRAMMPISNLSPQMTQGPSYASGISYINYPSLVQPIPSTFPLASAAQPEPTISERAARLLFMNIKWIKSIASFTSLSMEDQHVLLESSWKELFIIGASQYLNVHFSELVQSLDMSKRDKEQAIEFIKDISNLQNAIYENAKLRLDPQEYAYLRGLCLYKVFSAVNDGEQKNRFANKSQIMDMYNHTHLSLQFYIRSTYPYQLNRFNIIMDLWQSMEKVKPTIIEDLFFRDTIGQITIERIIIDMYKAQ
ncbi:PREDICTED: nuclear receptor subfamily 2 group E member 1-like [Nicrophorus vespilloides]|uniref:Nuclear receptor subfamily 2 group E member 1-like n=1 Tax=Nicrophorus vespilloides TaxID=110193 RepID=A0ABM1M034_NICVS|nr:PREDICTED: nuclear receptor subfamily 2 group E member 1-like [Nicrophorus vespilloides]